MTAKDEFSTLDRVLEFPPVINPSPRTLTREQISHYNEFGYIAPLDVFSDAEIAEHRVYFERLLDEAVAAGGNRYSINSWHTRCEGMYDLVVESRILDYVEDIVGENVICWGTHYFCKDAGDTKRVSWHQDASYWPITPSETVTVWLALDDSDEENGAMKVIPGSHRYGQIEFDTSDDAENNVLHQTIPGVERFGEPVSVVLKAGQISLHNDLLLHGSEPNPSTRRRCGLTLRYCSPAVRAYHDWQRFGVIARGTDPAGYWPNPPRPNGDDIPPNATIW